MGAPATPSPERRPCDQAGTGDRAGAASTETPSTTHDAAPSAQVPAGRQTRRQPLARIARSEAHSSTSTSRPGGSPTRPRPAPRPVLRERAVLRPPTADRGDEPQPGGGQHRHVADQPDGQEQLGAPTGRAPRTPAPTPRRPWRQRGQPRTGAARPGGELRTIDCDRAAMSARVTRRPRAAAVAASGQATPAAAPAGSSSPRLTAPRRRRTERSTWPIGSPRALPEPSWTAPPPWAERRRGLIERLPSRGPPRACEGSGRREAYIQLLRRAVKTATNSRRLRVGRSHAPSGGSASRRTRSSGSAKAPGTSSMSMNSSRSELIA